LFIVVSSFLDRTPVLEAIDVFGDITLGGTTGRLISVAIMIFGVTLFLRLIRALLQPQKVRFPCPTCGLQRHDFDAVHCKACGDTLNIPDEGASL
jgi:voltage-gated potassium channel